MSSPLNIALTRQSKLKLTHLQKNLIMECFLLAGIPDKVAVAAVLDERFNQVLVDELTKRKQSGHAKLATEYLMAQCYERGILERPKPSLWQRICALFRKEAPATVPAEPPLGTPKKVS